MKLNDWRDVDDDEEEEEEEEAIKVVDGDVVEKGKVGKKRQISYTLLLNLNFGPKQSPSREKQVISQSLYAKTPSNYTFMLA